MPDTKPIVKTNKRTLDYYVPVQGSAPADNVKAVQSIDKTKIVAPEKAKVMSDIKKEIRQRQDDQLIFERKKKIKEADEVQKKMSVIPGGKGWTKENMAKAVQAIPDKMRLFPDDPNSFFDEWLNVPKMIVGEGAKALGEAPLAAEQTGSVSPYVSAVAMPLITGRMLGASTFNPLKASTWTTENTTGNFINNIVNPLIPYETTKGAANVVKDAFVSNPARGTTSLLEGKNHPLYKIWKSSAKELGVEDWDNEIGVESLAEVARVRKKKLEATFFAAGNRLANFTNTIPIVKDVQKELGKRIASQSSYPIRSVGEIKDAFTGLLKRDPIQDTYTGVLSPGYADPERNLLDNFIYQNDKGFTEYKGDIIKKGLDKYIKRHGDMKTYDLGLLYGGKDEPFSLHDITSGITLPEKVGIKQGLSQVGQSEYEKLALLKKYLKDSGETISGGADNNLRNVNDNIAGHMRYLTYDKESDQVMGHVRDIWKFDPDDYTKWAKEVNANKYITEKQAGMLSTVGKPFLLYKKAPVTVEGHIDQVPLFGPHDDFGKAVKVLGSDVSKKINVPEPLPFAYGGVVALRSRVRKGQLMHQIEVDDEIQQFDGGTGKDGVENPYKKVDAFAANTFRNLLPVPDNVAQMIAKTTFGDARMNNKSLDDKQKIILWNTIQNAKQRSRKESGGTEYEDYGNQGFGDPNQFVDWFNKGKLGFKDLVVNSTTNPGFKLASTIGRGRYWTDPSDPTKIQYTDVYDWNPSEKNFGGKNIYQKLRNKVRAGEDENLNVDKNDNYRMNFELRESEIDSLLQEHPDMLPAKVNNAIYKPKKATVQPMIKRPGGMMEQMAYGGTVLKSKVKNGVLYHQIEVDE